MSKSTKVWLIVATALLVVGCMVFGGVMIPLKWGFETLSMTKMQTNTYTVTDAYTNISIATDTADITFLPSEDGTCKVVCHDQEKMYHKVMVQDDTLTVYTVNERKWYDYIQLYSPSQKITVYLPKSTYGTLTVKSDTSDLKIPKDFTFQSIDVSQSTGDVTNYASALGEIRIKTSTGDILVHKVSAKALTLTASTGKITATDIACTGDATVSVSTGKVVLNTVTCHNLLSTGNTGKVEMENVTAQTMFSVTRTTGDVTLEKCDAAEILIKTDTGDVAGSLLTEKVFIVQSDTGNVTVPETVSGGRCKITTDTGDIYMCIAE